MSSPSTRASTRHVLEAASPSCTRSFRTPVRDCFSNAFSNLRGPSTAINNALQGKPAEAASDVGRFAINTTIGMVGCFDVGLATWGLSVTAKISARRSASGASGRVLTWCSRYCGPSTRARYCRRTRPSNRSSTSNFYIDLPALEYTVLGLRIVNERAELLPARQADQRGRARQVHLHPRRLPAAAPQPGVRRQSAARARRTRTTSRTPIRRQAPAESGTVAPSGTSRRRRGATRRRPDDPTRPLSFE